MFPISESARDLRRIEPPPSGVAARWWSWSRLTVAGLDIVRPDGFRTRVEKFGKPVCVAHRRQRQRQLKPSKLALDDAKAMLAATEARRVSAVHW